jgi:protein ImuB
MRPVLKEDHRPEWMQTWQPAAGQGKPKLAKSQKSQRSPRVVDTPQPSWLLAKPLKLAVASERPMYQGPLQLVLGPHRVEGGWWHRVQECAARLLDSAEPACGYFVGVSGASGA